MSTPIVDVFMFESVINIGIASLLLAGGINDPKKQSDPDGQGLKTPRCEIKTVWGGFPTEHYFIKAAGEKYPDVGQAVAYLKIITRRGDKDQDHDRMVGTIRWLLQDVIGLSQKMTLHRVEKILEAGSVPDFQQDQHNDITTLSFRITLSILYASKTATIFPT